jgi:hypothetical protein
MALLHLQIWTMVQTERVLPLSGRNSWRMRPMQSRESMRMPTTKMCEDPGERQAVWTGV